MEITRKSFIKGMGLLVGSVNLKGFSNFLRKDHTGVKKYIDSSKQFKQISSHEELGIIQSKANNKSTPTNTSSYWLQYTDASNALFHHIATQAYNHLERRKRVVNELDSLADWQVRQQLIKEFFLDAIGPFPSKTPLNAKITRTLNKKNYQVEHIIYESRPEFHVSSSLFIPDKLRKPAPAIIYTSGHGGKGYRYSVYQHVILNLVRKGFIVFAFDPIGQGERREYSQESGVRGTTKEHSYAGAQSFMIDQTMAQYMIWDGIRAVDYLLSRKEVDPTRIGITGRSGGGCQAAYIGAIDERIYASVPECYITSFKRLFQSIGPQDAEQNLISEIAKGIDEADYLVMRAPKPTLMITTTRDIFSIQGARETAREVSHIYEAYGKKDHFGMVEDDAIHESTQKNREAMYAFFQKYLNNPGLAVDEDVALLSQKELQVTHTGQIGSSLGGETVFSLNRRQAKIEVHKLQVARKSPEQHFANVLNVAKKLSGYQKPEDIGQPVFTGRFQKEGYVIEKYFVPGEGNYPIPYLLLIPDKSNQKAVIFLNPSGKAAVLRQKKWFVEKGITVMAPDLLDTGEMGEGDFRGDSYIGDTSYNKWFASILIGRSITGMQAGDVTRLVRLLYERDGISEVYGLACQQMGPVLLHTAAFDSSIKRVALVESYASYRSIVMNQFYDPGFIPSCVAGVLTSYDLPDLAASLVPRKLLMIGIRDEMNHPAKLERIKKDLSIIKAAYHSNDASKQLDIVASEKTAINNYNSYEKWIR